MKILALESSALVASVAIVTEEELVGLYTINYKKTHSQTLLPMLDELCKQIELNTEEIDAIAVTGGPGSFTGLRIGAATAKGLGLAWGKPLISVPTAEAMAYQMYGNTGIICPLLNARRQQVYTGLYEFDQEKCFRVVEEQSAIAMTELIDQLNQMGREVTFLGDGVPVHAALIKETLKVPFHFAPAHCNRQNAAALATRALEYYKEGKWETAAEHKPDYLRVSQAERERMEREG